MQTESSKKKVGDTTDSWCGKCKMLLAHTIEAMIGEKPARVHCNTCKSQHAYRRQAPSSAPRQPKQHEGTGATAPPKMRASRYESLLKAKSAEVPKPYSPKDKYEAGDVLDHPTFGRGITKTVKDETKIEVLFESGPKTLVQGR